MHKNDAIKSYKKSDGKTYYKFKIYLGVDPLTNKEKTTTRSGFSSPSKAQTTYDKLKYEFKHNLHQIRQKKTYSDVYTEWLYIYKNSNIEMSTYDKTVGYFKNHILPYFGNIKIDKITTKKCQEFAAQLTSKLKYFNHIVNYASDVLNTAVSYNYILNNPFNKVKKIKEKKSSSNDNYLSKAEFLKLLEYFKDKNHKQHLLFRIFGLTGIRRGEAIALTWADIDFNKKEISITKTLSYSKQKNGRYLTSTKTGTSRKIKIDDETLVYLEAWKKEQIMDLHKLDLSIKKDKEQLIFNSIKNNYLGNNTANRWLTKALNSTKIKKITVHGLRHTHATLLEESGANLPGIAQRLGHSTSRNITMEVYIHITEKVKLDTLKCFLKYLYN